MSRPVKLSERCGKHVMVDNAGVQTCSKREGHDGRCDRPRTKQRTVVAWAVCCDSGKIHDGFSGVSTDRLDMAWLVKLYDRRPAYKCGPHTLTPLTGTFTPRPSPRRKR